MQDNLLFSALSQEGDLCGVQSLVSQPTYWSKKGVHVSVAVISQKIRNVRRTAFAPAVSDHHHLKTSLAGTAARREKYVAAFRGATHLGAWMSLAHALHFDIDILRWDHESATPPSFWPKHHLHLIT